MVGRRAEETAEIQSIKRLEYRFAGALPIDPLTGSQGNIIGKDGSIDEALLSQEEVKVSWAEGEVEVAHSNCEHELRGGAGASCD